jgi:hypothetical protein
MRNRSRGDNRLRNTGPVAHFRPRGRRPSAGPHSTLIHIDSLALPISLLGPGRPLPLMSAASQGPWLPLARACSFACARSNVVLRQRLATKLGATIARSKSRVSSSAARISWSNAASGVARRSLVNAASSSVANWRDARLGSKKFANVAVSMMGLGFLTLAAVSAAGQPKERAPLDAVRASHQMPTTRPEDWLCEGCEGGGGAFSHDCEESAFRDLALNRLRAGLFEEEVYAVMGEISARLRLLPHRQVRFAVADALNLVNACAARWIETNEPSRVRALALFQNQASPADVQSEMDDAATKWQVERRGTISRHDGAAKRLTELSDWDGKSDCVMDVPLAVASTCAYASTERSARASVSFSKIMSCISKALVAQSAEEALVAQSAEERKDQLPHKAQPRKPRFLANHPTSAQLFYLGAGKGRWVMRMAGVDILAS